MPTESMHMLINRGARMRLNKNNRAAARSVRLMLFAALVSLLATCSSAATGQQSPSTVGGTPSAQAPEGGAEAGFARQRTS